MGAVMAPACADTIYRHLSDMKRTVDDYDLILSGDLGIYGKKILIDYMKEEYKINLNNYDDTACMIYDIENQPVYAGGSGPACAPLVTYGYIMNLMKEGKLKRVLLVATGSLHSTATVNEHMTIPAIAHAISLEVFNDLL
jgi:stage V sporulation protein AD